MAHKNVPQYELRRYRLEAELSQRQLAELLRLSEDKVQRAERGLRLPTLKEALKLAALFGVSVESLFQTIAQEARRELRAVLRRIGGVRAALVDTPRARRVLAIEPWYRGIGIAVLYGEEVAVCRVRHLKASAFPERLLKTGTACVEELFVIHRPGVLALPVPDFRRGRHIHTFLLAVHALALRRGIKVTSVRRATLHDALGAEPRAGRYRVAALVAERFPRLRAKLPPPQRRWWLPEHADLKAFYAVGLALAARKVKAGTTGPSPRQAKAA